MITLPLSSPQGWLYFKSSWVLVKPGEMIRDQPQQGRKDMLSQETMSAGFMPGLCEAICLKAGTDRTLFYWVI